jgi:hypothetical protein
MKILWKKGKSYKKIAKFVTKLTRKKILIFTLTLLLFIWWILDDEIELTLFKNIKIYFFNFFN